MQRKMSDTVAAVEPQDELTQARPEDEQAKEWKDAENKKEPGEVKGNKSGFYCYIGPNRKGIIQTGAIFRGTREEALEKAGRAIQTEPLVKTLIVSGDELGAARRSMKTPGTMLYANCRKLARKDGK